MKHKTVWFLVTAYMMLASGACACAPSPQIWPTPQSTALPTVVPSPIPQSGTQAAPQSTTALDLQGCEVHLWHSFTREKEATLRDLAARFEAENPDKIRLRIEFHASLNEEVSTSLAAGTPPDIVVASSDQIAGYALTDAVVPLSDYLDSAKHGLSPAEQADLWPVVFEAAQWLPRTKRPMGMLFDSQAVVMFYNVGWLKKLKFDAPPQNWDDFGKACSKARDRKAGTWGCALAMEGPVLVNWIAGLGGALVDPASRDFLLDSPEAVAALSWLDDSIQNGYVYCTSEADTARADFAAEKVLFTLGTTADLPAYAQAILSTKTKKPRFEWAIVPLPHAGSEPTVSVQGSVISILRTTPRQQLAAWLFLKWLLRPENDARWVLATGALPLRKSTKDLPEMQAYLKQNAQYKAACQWLTYTQAEPAVPGWQEVRALLASAAATVCLGKANPADALAAADAAAASLASR
jgi:ABC-type glycerol-3-phosphate transport system substrate-binding protein